MKNKFIFYDEISAVIEDYTYYADHEEEIDNWLKQHNCVREGMILHFLDESIKMLFILRWS